MSEKQIERTLRKIYEVKGRWPHELAIAGGYPPTGVFWVWEYPNSLRLALTAKLDHLPLAQKIGVHITGIRADMRAQYRMDAAGEWFFVDDLEEAPRVD